MSRFSVLNRYTALAGAVVLAMNSANASGSKQSRVAWGYSDIINQDYACEATCFGLVEIFHLGIGTYDIEMGRIYIPDPSNLQVSSAENTTLSYCAIVGWSHGQGRNVDAYVNCYDINGNPTDSYFSFLYQSREKPFGSADKGIAFLWADQPTEASYTPNLAYQYNSTGATNTMVRNGTGSYTAAIPGLTKKGGNVQVTAYGSAPARCKISGWSSGQAGTSVNILCFDVTGAAADEMFTLAYTIGEPLGLNNGRVYHTHGQYGDDGAYAWANKAEDTNVYTPSRPYNYNGFKTGPLTAQKNSTGVYTIDVPGETFFGGGSAVLVSADGTSNGFCTAGDGLEDWDPFQVLCYDQNGNPADSEFSVLLQTTGKN